MGQKEIKYTQYTCDRCGTQMKPGENPFKLIGLKKWLRFKAKHHAYSFPDDVILCDKCQYDFQKFIGVETWLQYVLGQRRNDKC